MARDLDRDTTVSDRRRGERAECELCGETRRCFERFGILSCEPCQAMFLPTGGSLGL